MNYVTGPITEEITSGHVLEALNTSLSGITSSGEDDETLDHCMPLETRTTGIASCITVRGTTELESY